MTTLTLTIPERLEILKALSTKTGLIDTILVGLVREKIQFSIAEIEYAELADGVDGEVTYNEDKPIKKIIPLMDCEARLLDDRFGSASEYETLKERIGPEL